MRKLQLHRCVTVIIIIIIIIIIGIVIVILIVIIIITTVVIHTMHKYIVQLLYCKYIHRVDRRPMKIFHVVEPLNVRLVAVTYSYSDEVNFVLIYTLVYMGEHWQSNLENRNENINLNENQKELDIISITIIRSLYRATRVAH